jgi:hypothetical protein
MGHINAYDSAQESDAHRAQQKALLAALGAQDRALRRDECGAWAISGKHGSISTWGDGETWVVFVGCRSAQHWTWTKKKLSFCSVTQDGDNEGCLRLHQLPTPEQASVIRDVLGIRKRQEICEATRERLRVYAFEREPRNEAGVEPNIGRTAFAVPEVPPVEAPILDAEPA